MAVTASPVADEILIGNVLTLDAQRSTAEAIAIAGGKVLAVGGQDAVLQTSGIATVVRRFDGCTIIPGFNDTHAHMDGVGIKTIRPSLAGARSIRDILDRIAALTREVPPGSWIVTMPVGEPPYYFDAPSGLSEKRMPTRQELDSVAPNHPVFLSSPNGFWGQPPCHSAMNTLGLRLNGVHRDTKPRANGLEIVRDADGEPNGVFIEHNYVNMLERDLLPAVPRFSYEQRRAGLTRAMQAYHAKGTTSIYEGHGNAPEILSACREIWERNELTMRMSLVVSPAWSDTIEAERAMRDWLPLVRGRGIGDAMFRIAGVFIAYGGDPCVTHIVQKNITDIGWSGLIQQANTPKDFEELCMLAARYDLRVHTVVSDKLHEIVPVMERIAQQYPIGARRWVLEHVSQATSEDLQRVKKIGATVTLIPPHYLWKVGHRFLNLSPEQLDLLSPAGQLFEMGVPVAAGTDAVPYDPLFCMWAMTVRRERTTGRIMGEGGRVSNETALRLLTTCGAWLTFEEHVKGPLAPGYYADLAVMSGNPLTVVGDDLLELRCRATMVGGRWVYDDS